MQIAPGRSRLGVAYFAVFLLVMAATVTSALARPGERPRPTSALRAPAPVTEPPSLGPSSVGPSPSPPIPALKAVFAGRFAIGASVGATQVSGAQADLLTQQFSSITPTNAMKWTSTEPTSGSFDFSAADAIVDFSVANDIKVRGHTLVWHRQTPDWVFQDPTGAPMTPTPRNKALLLSRMETREGIAIILGLTVVMTLASLSLRFGRHFAYRPNDLVALPALARETIRRDLRVLERNGLVRRTHKVPIRWRLRGLRRHWPCGRLGRCRRSADRRGTAGQPAASATVTVPAGWPGRAATHQLARQ